MGGYAGAGIFPYWLAINGDGTSSNVGIQSEQVQVTPGLTYTFTATAAYEADWGNGYTIYASWFTSTGTANGSMTQVFSGAMTAGNTVTLTTSGTAPANTSYVILQLSQAGTPDSSNALQVYQAQLTDPNGVSLNANYGFTYTTFPWSILSPPGTGTITWQYDKMLAGDADSVVIADQIELMGGTGGVPCDIPELLDENGEGPTFQIFAPSSMNATGYGYQGTYDFNAPQPTQDVVASMLLDGERPFGTRSSNRTITLPLMIKGTLAGGMGQVLNAMEYLMQILDQQTFTMKWTPSDTGLPMVFDCFRALPSTQFDGFNYNQGNYNDPSAGRTNNTIGAITVQFQALPYGRSDVDGIQTLAFDNPIIAGQPNSTAFILDPYNSVQNGKPYLIANKELAAGTSVTFSPTLPVANGDGLILTYAAGNATSVGSVPAVSDSRGNGWDIEGQVSNATGPASKLYVFTAGEIKGLTPSDTVTVTNTNSEARTITLIGVPGFQSVEAGVTETTGTTTPFSVVSPAVTDTKATVFTFIANNNTETASTPSGWSAFTESVQGSVVTDGFWKRPGATGTQTFSSTMPTGTSWSAVSFVANCTTAAANTQWNFDTIHSPVNNTGHSVRYSPPNPVHMPWPAATYTANVVDSSGVPQIYDITNRPILSFNFGQAYDTQWPTSPKFVSNVAFHVTLFDDTGRTLTFAKNVRKCPWGPNPSNPKWTVVNMAIPQGNRLFRYNRVVQYQIRIVNWAGSGATGFVHMHGWLNDLQALPQTIANAASPRGNVYNLFGLPGTARAPINVNCQLPALAPKTQEFTASSGTWTVPDYVYSVMAEAIGGGAAGASVNTAVAGAGGGGGEYAAESALVVTPGTAIPWSVGAGGIAAQLNPTVATFTKSGLNHWTCPTGVTQVKVECWGAGGAGAAGGGGGGGGAYVWNTLVKVTPGKTYNLWVGAGGKANTGTTSAANAGRQGQASWFGPPGSTVAGNAYLGAGGSNTPLTGGSTGGGASHTVLTGVALPAGSSTNHVNAGGAGGVSPGPAGGGGGSSGAAAGAGTKGGDSPSTNKYTKGGTGATGQTGLRGAGGNGANAPGVASKGTQPGGGGGGGYSSGKANYIGADGGTGMVQLTYAIGDGNPVNAGNSVFGSSSTTSTVVTAHGATSVATNAIVGGSGGTGSSNSTHFNGGGGAFNTTNFPDLGVMSAQVTRPLINLVTSTNYTANTTGVTTAASSNALSQGTAIAVIGSAAFDTNLAVSDSAGNQYQLDQTATASDGTSIAVFSATVTNPITTSTTLTTTGTVSQSVATVWWIGGTTIAGPVLANASNASGSSSSASVASGTGDNASYQLGLWFTVNNSTSAITLPNNPYGAVSAGSGTSTNGTLEMGTTCMAALGGAADTPTFTLGSSAPWAAVCVPFATGQQTFAVGGVGFTNVNAATQGQITTKAVAQAGSFVLVETQVVTTGTAATSISDSASNHWNSLVVASASGGTIQYHWSLLTTAIPQGGTITVGWGSTSVTGTVSTYKFDGISGVDSPVPSVTTGNSSSPSSPSATYATANDLVFTVFSNSNSQTLGSPTASPSGTSLIKTGANHNSTKFADAFLFQKTASSGTVVSGTYSATSTWSAIQFALVVGGTGGGGGGASAGPQGAGQHAINSLGAIAGTGGGKGGLGALAINSNGGAASLPGGGGGGAYSSDTSPDIGGNGGSGMVRLTWQPPLQPFNNLILHRPGLNASPALSPLQVIPITDTPTNIEYPVQSLIATQPAIFNSTYTVMLVASSWNSTTSSSARNITVTINQYEYANGPAYTVQATRTVTPATDIVNGLVTLGEVTLPIKDIPSGNDQAYFTFSVNDTDTGDRFQDVLFLDTTGQTVIVNIPSGSPAANQYVNYFVDEPSADKDLGLVAGTFQNRKASVSVLDYTLMSGGPLYVDPGDNLLMAYSISGAPSLAVTYSPRWYHSRTV